MKHNAKVLVVHNKPVRFVRLDEQILAERYQVTDYLVEKRTLHHPFSLWSTISAHDFVFGWFASWHTLLPVMFARLLSKPTLVVSGGYDVANLPDIGYGHQRGGLKKWVARLVLRLADVVVVNSNFSKREAVQNAGQDPDHVRVIYHGVPDSFGASSIVDKRRMALSVGNLDRENLWRKGLGPFAQAAQYCPDVTFSLVGAWQDDSHKTLEALGLPNLHLTGWVDDAAWERYYQESSVYVQASMHEGFGMSLAEGMLAGCFPVVTNKGAIPEVVGNVGYMIDEPDPEKIAEGVRVGLILGHSQREMIRERILQQFSMERRSSAFYKIMDPML
jgi:glycosyltransferase involved in cell wall biosynthesis